MKYNLLIHRGLQSSHCFLQPTVIVPHAHWGAYGRGSLPARSGQIQRSGNEVADDSGGDNTKKEEDDDDEGEKLDKRKKDGEANEGAQVVKTHNNVYSCTICKLSNNNFSESENFAPILKAVIHEATSKLTSLDLSFNRISTIPNDIAEFPLVFLYLHANNITKITELQKLVQVKTLRTVTLHGNPVENTTRNYKYHILWMMPELKSLDFASFTRRDRETVKTYVDFYKPAEQPPKQVKR